MGIAFLILWLLFIIVGVGALVTVVLAVVAGWKKALWGIGFTALALVCVFGGWAFLAWLADDRVGREVSTAEMVGVYRAIGGSKNELKDMGYDESGELALLADGSFTGHRIPASCVKGEDERSYPTGGGYYELRGRWELAPGMSTNRQVLKLTFASSELSDQKAVTKPRTVFGSQAEFVEVTLVSGRPVQLGFEIFNGDFFRLVYTR